MGIIGKRIFTNIAKVFGMHIFTKKIIVHESSGSIL